jgi:type II secretory pathway pseudopilin PulG
VLLEVIVALVILAMAGISAIGLVQQAQRSVDTARSADADMRSASAFFDAVSLWPREDLDRRLGSRRQGRWMLSVDRPARTLYRVALFDSTGQHRILETAVFRVTRPHAPE